MAKRIVHGELALLLAGIAAEDGKLSQEEFEAKQKLLMASRPKDRERRIRHAS